MAGLIAPCIYDGQVAGGGAPLADHLKALTYASTGGIVAAATTCLPEQLGGVTRRLWRLTWASAATLVRPGTPVPFGVNLLKGLLGS